MIVPGPFHMERCGKLRLRGGRFWFAGKLVARDRGTPSANFIAALIKRTGLLVMLPQLAIFNAMAQVHQKVLPCALPVQGTDANHATLYPGWPNNGQHSANKELQYGRHDHICAFMVAGHHPSYPHPGTSL